MAGTHKSLATSWQPFSVKNQSVCCAERFSTPHCGSVRFDHPFAHRAEVLGEPLPLETHFATPTANVRTNIISPSNAKIEEKAVGWFSTSPVSRASQILYEKEGGKMKMINRGRSQAANLINLTLLDTSACELRSQTKSLLDPVVS